MSDITELQIPTKEELYGASQSKANKLNNFMIQLTDFAEFLGFLDASDLTSIGVPSEVQTDLAQYRTVLSELIDFFNGTSTTQTYTPADIIDTIRSI